MEDPEPSTTGSGQDARGAYISERTTFSWFYSIPERTARPAVALKAFQDINAFLRRVRNSAESRNSRNSLLIFKYLQLWGDPHEWNPTSPLGTDRHACRSGRHTSVHDYVGRHHGIAGS